MSSTLSRNTLVLIAMVVLPGLPVAAQETVASGMTRTELQAPYVPCYAGHKVVDYSYVMKDLPAGAGFQMSLDSADEPDTVLGWYRDVLKTNGWSYVPSKAQPQTITAFHRKSRLTYTVTVKPSSKPGMRSRIASGFQPY